MRSYHTFGCSFFWFGGEKFGISGKTQVSSLDLRSRTGVATASDVPDDGRPEVSP